MSHGRRVVKVGGSLLGDAALWSRLDEWLDRDCVRETFLVVGGGAMVDSLRDLDRRFTLDEVDCHWWCIQVMAIHAQMAAKLLPRSTLVRLSDGSWPATPGGRWIVDPLDFVQTVDCRSAVPLPESWDVTSDSIAARVAEHTQADTLCLLKSAAAPGTSLADWIAAGYVDRYLDQTARGLCSIQAIDFRNPVCPATILSFV